MEGVKHQHRAPMMQCKEESGRQWQLAGGPQAADGIDKKVDWK
jgi:hypothetical protein